MPLQARTPSKLVVIGDKYLDGYATAELLGITMPEPDETEGVN
ncbi:hypothetical protein P3102_33905 [Amycolatopsis sp. QT-25]|nr:hypothetical protein [Amycolatopsis sp. QT-25]WET78978.1 hypothetical protein P3102_33905 [Amycolatopsis sp. QT-25]